MGYWDPPEYFDEAKFPEIDAETDTLIEHLVGAIKEEYKDKIAKASDAYQDLKASYDSLRRELTNKNSDLLAKDGLIETLNKELAKKKTEHPSFKFNIGDTVYFSRVVYNSEKKVFCPRCGGKGYITLDVKTNNLPADITDPVTYICPDCRNSTGSYLYNKAKHFREYRYYNYYVEKGKVLKIEYVIGENETSTRYFVKSATQTSPYFFAEQDLYETFEQASPAAQCDKELSYIEACNKVGIAPNLINKEASSDVKLTAL